MAEPRDEEEEYFTLEEIKEKLENKKSWNPYFKAGLEDMEVEQIEKHLKSRAVKEGHKTRLHLLHSIL
ncbi:hypothetical protein OS493_030868 [Desmophyllum pertusum]|uniref:Uncharacterized protein n=1 Tax=Desmophyllum pertusum TaxID=174260 RepID=A0A9W9Y8M6_9CNID|nr:hypothetical protein OS493_030868 [Desmophyllum pertusum]